DAVGRQAGFLQKLAKKGVRVVSAGHDARRHVQKQPVQLVFDPAVIPDMKVAAKPVEQKVFGLGRGQIKQVKRKNGRIVVVERSYQGFIAYRALVGNAVDWLQGCT